jgi:putative acetyltransferase
VGSVRAGVVVRAESPSDFRDIRRLVEAAFGRPDEADLVERLRADGAAVVAAVAIDSERVIGHLMLSRMAAPFRALGLAPVAVTPDRQGEGVGSELIRWVLARAQEQAWDAVFVLGDPAFYRRFGFDPGPAAGFISPYAGPHLMVLSLGRALPVSTGRVDYASAFSALG